jgi:multicomponent Na+:H+ antiporter subunit G
MDGAAAIIVDALAWASIAGGSVFLLAGAVGVLRCPDVYTRMHAAGITDTLGAGLVLLGLAFEAGFTLVTVKLALIMLFLLITSPTSCHALANAAYHGGVKPILDRDDTGGAP